MTCKQLLKEMTAVAITRSGETVPVSRETLELIRKAQMLKYALDLRPITSDDMVGKYILPRTRRNAK